MSCDWGKLVSQGRAKAIGISWTEEELKAIYKDGIPAEAVRNGILTKEDLDKSDIDLVPFDEKLQTAKTNALKAGINFTDKATIETLEKEVQLKETEKKVRKDLGIKAYKYENMDYIDLKVLAKEQGFGEKGMVSKAKLVEYLNNLK